MRESVPLDPEASFTAAMELCELLPQTDVDPVREREVEATRQLWTKLRAAWAAKHP